MTGLYHQDNVVSFPGETSVEVEAAAAKWLTVMHSGATSLPDLMAFEIWKSDSPDHERIYLDMERIWASLGSVGLEAAPIRRKSWWGSNNGGRTFKAAAWAASVAAVLVCAQLSVRYLNGWRYDYHTRPGQIQTVLLPDGSTASLKGDTALNVRISGTGTRRVELARGEAFFEVKHDAVRPFVVESGGAVVEDLGTGFSVERNGDTGGVSVEHGSVRVAIAGRSDVLVGGEGVRFNPYYISQIAHVDPEEVSAWRRGLYFAKDEPLGQVLDELDAYYPGKIVVIGHKLRTQPINAVVQLSRIDAWLGALGKISGVYVHRFGSVVVISSSSS